MSAHNPTSNVFVVNTNKYTGNFEREMCAYITGQTGECGVGRDVAEDEALNIKNLDWFEDNIAQEADEHECFRPASIWATPGRFNDGYGNCYDDTPEVRATLKPRQAQANFPAYESVAIFLEELPPPEVLEEMIARAQAYCANNSIEYRGCTLLKPVFEMVVVQQRRVSHFSQV